LAAAAHGPDKDACLKLGILGGTFDPVHNAHLEMARAALRELGLDRVLWIPTGAPAYRKPPVASADDRVAMLKLALKGEARYQIDERELAPGASGYTVDTLRALKREYPNAELFLLIGADQYEKFREWREPDDVARLAELVVFPRPGFRVEGDARVVAMPSMPVASTGLRKERKLAGLVPPAVANYIERKGLYR
jgi:nicotinate-nucleotide adenylyltransferase